MKLCDFENHTMISLESGFEHLISVKDGRIITGAIGSCIDRVLCRLEDRKCSIIGRLGLGIKHENGSYSGILGMLQRKEADFYFKGEQEYLNEPWLKRSTPLRSENLLVIQPLHTNDDDVDYYDLIQNLNFGLEILIYYLIFLLITLLFILVMSRFTIEISSRRFRRRNLIDKLTLLSQHFFTNSENYLVFRVFFLFFGLFLWFSLLFLTNNIKTNKVVVDVSKLIKNRDDILDSKKLFCFFQGDTEMNMAKDFPKENLLSRMFHEKTRIKEDQKEMRSVFEDGRCFPKLDPKMVSLFERFKGQFSLVLSEAEANFHLILYSEARALKRIWILNRGVQEFNVVRYYSMRNSINQRAAEDFSRTEETGLTVKMYDCMKDNARFLYQKTSHVFYSIEEYIQEEYQFSDLEFTNFRSIFVIYFSLLFLYVVCFIFSNLIEFGLFSFFFNLIRMFFTKIIEKLYYY